VNYASKIFQLKKLFNTYKIRKEWGDIDGSLIISTIERMIKYCEYESRFVDHYDYKKFINL
jgi:hypothetical protein